MRAPLSLIAALCVSASACGKKGPPLPPFVRIPAAVDQIEALRLGTDVYVSLAIPAANVDEHTPADISRVEVFGYTGRSAPSRARWTELATLVVTVPVAPPPLEQDEKPDPTRTAEEPENAPQQADKISVRDTLTADELVQGKEAPAIRDPQAATEDSQSAGPADGGSRTAELPLKRFYTAVPFNSRGVPGPPGGVAEFAIEPTPDPPPSVTAQYSERAIVLEWEPSGGLIGFLLERVLPEDPPPFEEDEASEPQTAAEPPLPLSYLIYRDIPPDPLTPPGPPASTWTEEPPSPITPVPVAALTFTDNVDLGRRRCYTVRAVRGVGPAARTGDASPPVCFTAADTFPPASPRSVTTVASDGVISLIWEPNTELDLGGYVVLRGEAPGDTLRPVTKAAIANAGYRDETVTPGVRYVYAVVAVDNRFPLPNVSLISETVEETAR